MRRPFSVTILLWLVLSLTAWSGFRLVSAIQWWNTLLEFTTPPGPLYIASSGGGWLLVSIVLLWGMWQANAWIRYALFGTGASFTVWYWCDRLLFQPTRINWVFALSSSILLFVVLSICLFIPSTKTYFAEKRVT